MLLLTNGKKVTKVTGGNGLNELALFAGAGGGILGDICSDGELSVQSNGKHTQLAYCSPDKMTDCSRLSRFGMMFKPLTENLGKELLMSYRAGFHAKTFQPQEKAQELTVSGQECGKKWQGSFAKYDQNMSLWKTHQCSFIEELTKVLADLAEYGVRCGMGSAGSVRHWS